MGAGRTEVCRLICGADKRDSGEIFVEGKLTSVLTPADQTLRDGYGHSADRAVLLASLLKSAGVESRFVLVSALPDLPAFKPGRDLLFMPSMYDGVLVIAGGVALNDTDQYAALGSTAHNGKLALNLDNGALEEVRGTGDVTRIQYDIELDGNGAAVISQRQSYTGMAFAARNRLYSEMTPELRKRHEQNMTVAIAESAVQLAPLKVTLSESECVEELRVKVERFAVTNGNYLQFGLPGNIAGSLIRPLPEGRTYPYFINLNSKTSLEYRIKTAAGLAVGARMLPPDLEYRGIRVQSLEEAGGIRITVDADFTPVILSPLDYLTLRAVQAQLGHPAMNIVLLEKLGK